jgi:hypothetical protein
VSYPSVRSEEMVRRNTMNEIPHIERARITAMLLRVISELAGGDPGLDRAVAEALSGVIEVCHECRTESSPKAAQTAMQAALELVSDKDWLLTVKKVGQAFELEAKFGDEMKTTTLRETAQWLAPAGTN